MSAELRLVDLKPRWLNENLFAFLCPHCRMILLTCKRVAMSSREQHAVCQRALGEDWNMEVVCSKPDVAWKMSGDDFATMTISPSIDASASGHWHGHINQGRITK